MDKYNNKAELETRYMDCYEKEFFLFNIGYNDFRFIKPITLPRVQNINTLHIILNGSGVLYVDDKKYEVKEHDMFFIPPNVSLCYYPDKENLWSYVWFSFIGDNSNYYAQKIGLSLEHPTAPCNNFDSVNMALHLILDKLDKGLSVGYYEALSTFYKIVDLNSTSKYDNVSNIVNDVMTFVSCHYFDQKLTIERICHELAISHSYLCRLFKKTTNQTIKQYMVNFRMKEACRLLCETDLNIKEIAYSVGFSDDIHFVKTFKKFTGLTPKHYRNANW